MDMVTDDERKWKHIMHEDMPKRCGKLKPGELASFDAQFFGMHGQQAKVIAAGKYISSDPHDYVSQIQNPGITSNIKVQSDALL